MPVPAVLEIIDHNKMPADKSQLIPIPNEVRLNGVALWAPTDHPIRVHEIEISVDQLVLATITLICRRVTVGFEGDI